MKRYFGYCIAFYKLLIIPWFTLHLPINIPENGFVYKESLRMERADDVLFIEIKDITNKNWPGNHFFFALLIRHEPCLQ